MTEQSSKKSDSITDDTAFWSALKTFRHELHSNPFPSGAESPTIQRIRDFLERSGTFSFTNLAGGRGLLVEFSKTGEMKGAAQVTPPQDYTAESPIESEKNEVVRTTAIQGFNIESSNSSEIKSSPTILIRADVDALPIKETSGKSYASKNEKFAHSCGHDGHTTIVCGLAIILSQNPTRFDNISFVFQPAEETGEGAQWVLDDDGFNPNDYDVVIGFHNIPESELGEVYAREGVICAASSGITIHLSGETSHAASPEKGRSPVPAIQRILDDLDKYVTINSNAGQFLRVTTTGFQSGGPNFGISPGEGTIWLTLRTLDTELLIRSKEAIETITEKWAKKYGLEHQISYSEEFHATVNNSKLACVFEQAMKEHGITYHTLDAPNLWSEDFGRFSTNIPGFYFGIGAGPDTKPLHHSAYDFPDELLRPGIDTLKAFIQKLIL